jgi:hypothetical protein
MRACGTLLAVLLLAAPAAAQPADEAPGISFRPYIMFAGQQAAAEKTFKNTLGGSMQPFWGGGVQIATRLGPFFDIGASRFRKSGERVFAVDGDVFPLDIPLDVTVTPIEVTLGWRFRVGETGRLLPYLGAGWGSYQYREESEFSEADENVKVRKSGALAVGGIEYRAHRWVGVSADVQYTTIKGVLGKGGLSQELKEDDLGGISARFRVIIGR